MLKKVIDKNFPHMIRLEYILGSSSHRTVLIAGVVLVVITQLFFVAGQYTSLKWNETFIVLHVMRSEKCHWHFSRIVHVWCSKGLFFVTKILIHGFPVQNSFLNF